MSLEGSVVSERPITAIAVRHQMIVQYKVRGEGWDISNLYDSSRCGVQSKDVCVRWTSCDSWLTTDRDRGNLVTVLSSAFANTLPTVRHRLVH